MRNAPRDVLNVQLICLYEQSHYIIKWRTRILPRKEYNMAFSQEVKDQAYVRAGGRCEKCNRQCRRVQSGNIYNYPDSEFHHIRSVQAGGADTISNCMHLCIDCHERTYSYGRH